MKIGVVDTTFARVDMCKFVIEEIMRLVPKAKIVRKTVPGIKDIPLAALQLLEDENCDGVITLGWVGPSLVDKLSYVVSSMALQLVMLRTKKRIIDVTVHEDEAKTEEELYRIAEDRARKHARNLIILLTAPEELTKFAGKGLRQGHPDVGPILPP